MDLRQHGRKAWVIGQLDRLGLYKESVYGSFGRGRSASGNDKECDECPGKPLWAAKINGEKLHALTSPPSWKSAITRFRPMFFAR